jgi:N-acetylglutamate synthase
VSAEPLPAPDVAELELISARSWQGLEQERYGGWLLRAGGGFTGRANSVLVLGDPPAEPAAAVATVTRWYADRGLRPRAQVPRPGGRSPTPPSRRPAGSGTRTSSCSPRR